VAGAEDSRDIDERHGGQQSQGGDEELRQAEQGQHDGSDGGHEHRGRREHEAQVQRGSGFGGQHGITSSGADPGRRCERRTRVLSGTQPYARFLADFAVFLPAVFRAVVFFAAVFFVLDFFAAWAFAFTVPSASCTVE